MTVSRVSRSLGVAAVLIPGIAQAHPGHDVAAHPFLAGLLHPMSGFDHIAYAVAGGLLCLAMPRAQRTVSAATLLGAGALGMAVAAGADIHADFGIIPLALPAAVAVLCFAGVSARMTIALAIVSLLYGAAAMIESPLGTDPLAFGAGFVVGSGVIAIVAAGLGAAIKRAFAGRIVTGIGNR